MNVPDTLIIALAAAGFIGAWLAVMFWVPSNMCSLFRYRLWKIRDDMVDDLFAGRLPDVPVVRNDIRSAEDAISISSYATACRFLPVAIMPSLREEENRFSAEFDAIDALSEEHQRRLWAYREGMYGATTFHVLAGSPSGWLLAALILPIALMIAIPKGTRSLRGVIAEWKATCVRIVRMIFDDDHHHFGGGMPASARPLACMV